MGLRGLMRRILGRGEGAPPLWHPQRGSDYKNFWTSMSETPDDAVMATYGKMAPTEERVESCRYIARHIIESLAIDKTKTILEVGCGIGMFAHLVGPECGKYVGVDISPHMVAQARAFSKDSGGNLDFAVLERSDLALFDDETFDGVYFEAVLMHVAPEDAFNYLCEAHRVLKPGGRVYATFQNLLNPLGFQHFLRQAVNSDRTGNYAVGRVRFHTNETIKRFAERAGFALDPDHARLEPTHNDPTKHEDRILSLVATKTERPDWGVADGWPL